MMSPELADAREKMKRIPVCSLADLCTLDPQEVREGFDAGYQDMPCGDNMPRAYWHGWSVAMMNRGKMEISPFHRLLTREIFNRFGGVSTECLIYIEKQHGLLKDMGLV